MNEYYHAPFGWFDAVSSTAVSGWVWCVDDPSGQEKGPIEVTAEFYNMTTGLYEDPKVALANVPRPDVLEAGYGTGNYGFRIPVDWTTMSAGEYKVTVKTKDCYGTIRTLAQSPRYYSNVGVRLNKNELTLKVGETFTLSATVLDPAGTDTYVTWSLVPEYVNFATVNPTTGLVTAVAPGIVTVTARSNNGEYSASCTVFISKWPQADKPTILQRENWSPSPTGDGLEPRGIAKRIIFHHSADKFSSTDTNAIISEIQRIQTKHMTESNREYADIGYHYIIDPAGQIWEGRKAEYKGAHARGYNDDIGVLILGDYESRPANLYSPNTLNQEQKNAMITLSKWLCFNYELEKIENGPEIAPISTHRTVGDTECPGDNAAEWIEGELRTLINNWGA